MNTNDSFRKQLNYACRDIEDVLKEQNEQVIEEIRPKTDIELFMEFMKANKQTFIFILLIIIFFIIINIISKIKKIIKSRKKRE